MNDEALFSSTPRLGEATVRLPPGLTGLAFDERMTMHAEQSSAPHPERPDRIRAVIARLQASGLAGGLAKLHRLTYQLHVSLVHLSHTYLESWDHNLPHSGLRTLCTTHTGCMLVFVEVVPSFEP